MIAIIIIVAVVMVLACAAASKKISQEMEVKRMLAEDLKEQQLAPVLVKKLRRGDVIKVPKKHKVVDGTCLHFPPYEIFIDEITATDIVFIKYVLPPQPEMRYSKEEFAKEFYKEIAQFFKENFWRLNN